MRYPSLDIERRKILASNISLLVRKKHNPKYDLPSHSREEIARAIGVSIRQLERYMIGSSSPSAITLFKLCQFLKADIRSIFLTREEWETHLKGENNERIK